jgi:hypothetical protein
MGDARLLELRQDIALLDVRLTQLYRRLGTNESSASWKAVGSRLASYERQQGTPGELAALRALIAAINEPDGDQAASQWQDIREATEHRRKLVESERRLMVERSQMVSAAELVAMVDTILDTVRRHVDRDAMLHISRKVRALASVPDRRASALPEATGGGAE